MSDFDQNDSDSDHSFGSDTDSDVDQDTESTLFDLDSQASDIRDADFWSEIVEDIDVPEFVESSGPTHQLPSDANPLQFFMLVFPLALVQILVDNTNLYAAQSVAQGWVDTTIDEMKAFLGLQILMGIIQLPRYTMYWSSNKFMAFPKPQHSVRSQSIIKLQNIFIYNRQLITASVTVEF